MGGRGWEAGGGGKERTRWTTLPYLLNPPYFSTPSLPLPPTASNAILRLIHHIDTHINPQSFKETHRIRDNVAREAAQRRPLVGLERAQRLGLEQGRSRPLFFSPLSPLSIASPQALWPPWTTDHSENRRGDQESQDDRSFGYG